MKPVIVAPQYRVTCLRIEPVVAGVPNVQICAYPRNLTMSNSEVYLTGTGFQFTGYTSEANLAPGMVDLEGLAGVAGIDRDLIATGAFDNARGFLFATDYTNPVEDEEPITASLLGKATLIDERYAIQEFALVDVLSQSYTQTYGPTCPKKFGGQEFAGCKFDTSTVDVSGTITTVTDNANFEDSSLGETDDYYAVGTITWTSGNNVNLPPMTVKNYTAAGGVIELYEPAPYDVQVGDTYDMVPGCRKRLEDCRDKWGNVENFGGFTFIPVGSKYSKIGNK